MHFRHNSPCGSPPHPWGIPYLSASQAIDYRFTPTPVGNTIYLVLAVDRWSVHPHTRGEYARLCQCPEPQTVHPHTRGEYVIACSAQNMRVDRFTPTPVGNTQPGFEITGNDRRFTPTRVGNTFKACAYSLSRFTPTHVGNTLASEMLHFHSVHPHTRGEYLDSDLLPCHLNGSPPHPWGIRSCVAVGYRSFGSPPHPWGIRSIAESPYLIGSVHPHTRGEYVIQWITARIAVHPHTRGEYARWRLPDSLSTRFTPTHVGNTMTHGDRRILRHTVHPHTRGEYIVVLSGRQVISRFTPTRVGNTLKKSRFFGILIKYNPSKSRTARLQFPENSI